MEGEDRARDSDEHIYTYVYRCIDMNIDMNIDMPFSTVLAGWLSDVRLKQNIFRLTLDPKTTFDHIRMDAEDDSESPPPTHIRWFHAGHGLGHLDLLATPVVAKAASASNPSWTGFTRDESDRCEAAWQALSDEQRARALEGDPSLAVAAPVLNEDEEVRHDLIRTHPHHRIQMHFSFTILTRKCSSSASLSEKSGYSRSMCGRCAYVTSFDS